MYYLLFLIPIAFSSISPADYIAQSDRPKIAAHRGLCSIFPENTAQSFEGAMFQGTDFIELDVVLNKELQLIVAHDIIKIQKKKQLFKNIITIHLCLLFLIQNQCQNLHLEKEKEQSMELQEMIGG